MRVQDDDEAGFTLVETMVAIVIVTIAIFAMTAELTAYLHHQANERSRTTAVRFMTTAVENARRLTPATLASLPALSSGTRTELGKTYTTTTTLAHCSASDAPTACTTPTSAAQEDLRVRVTVSWSDGTTTKRVSTYTSVADDSTGTYSPTGSGTLSTLVGGVASTATSVTVSSFTASPSVVTVSSGTPTSAITLTLSSVGLTSSTSSIPVTWSDDNGSHQWSLTGGPSTWSATIPASSITKAVTSGTSSLVFAATVPGTSALTTATVTVKPAVTFGTCSVSPGTILLTVLTRKTALAETLTCTTTGLASTDSVTVSYPSGAGTAGGTLTSSNGTSWSLVLPAGTSMQSGVTLSETFTFTATRVSDSVTASKTLTAVMA